MKGLLLAGGSGSRLRPVTKSVNKHLLNVYDKPMIYYSLSTLMLSGLREIGLISTPDEIINFKKLLGDGSQFGISITYLIQNSPEGLPQAFVISEEYLQGESSCLMLGDNLFYGPTLGAQLNKNIHLEGAKIYGYRVANPEHYGIVELDKENKIISLEEKPKHTNSKIAVPGLYYLDSSAPELAKSLKKSDRGEYEILDLLKMYLQNNKLEISLMQRGTAWLDTGTPSALHDAASFVKTIQERQGMLISSPEEIALRQGWISKSQYSNLISFYSGSEYAIYLKKVLDE